MRLWQLISFVGLFALFYPSAAWSQISSSRTGSKASEQAAAALEPSLGDSASDISVDDATDCFGPRERLLFGGVLMTLQQAEATHQPSVTMVAQGSGAPELHYKEVSIAAFYHHHYTGGLITIETWDGHTLQVSMTHPMVRDTGEWVLAKDVRPEMRLFSATESTTVMRVRQSPFEGEIWHIEPAFDPNVLPLVVAEGLLCGTLSVQKASAAQNAAH